MRWAILLGSADISGGTYVIFEHAIRAKRRGTDVFIITDLPVTPNMLNWHPEARELIWLTFSDIEDCHFDVAIATWWRTVYELPRVKADSYAYFIQSIESRFYPEREIAVKRLAEATYMLPLGMITEATWIKEYLGKEYNQTAYLVLNGIRKDVYSNKGPAYSERESGKLRVLVEGPLYIPFKNVERTIALCKKSLANEVWLLTSSAIHSYPGADKVFSRIPIHQTPLIYRSCDVIVKLSYVEGMFGPPLEMFHCGGTAITYNVTGHDEYIVDGFNAFVVKKDDEYQVINALNRLKQETETLSELKQGALKTAQDWPDWECASVNFEGAIKKIWEQKNQTQQELYNKSKLIFDLYTMTAQNIQIPGKRIRAYLAHKFPYQYKTVRDVVMKIIRK